MTRLLAVALALFASPAWADPCGMVPPAWVSTDDPGIERTGDQVTYAFFDNGIQTIGIMPGFTGSVAEFGMLIPFPSAPSMRKMNEAAFDQLGAAVDPPFFDVHLYDPRPSHRSYKSSVSMPSGVASQANFGDESASLRFDEVRVLNQEAVGMYEIAVLEAGSPRALQRWMSDNAFRYPEGMDAVVRDYVRSGWVFVAVKAKVGQMPGVTPTPGMRGVKHDLPTGATFDGAVQGMVFRFEVEAPVIPMRLSTFNGDDTRNRVYLLTDRAVRISGLSNGFVQRQVSGGQLLENLTGLLPVRVHNGTIDEVTEPQWKQLESQRSPTPYNGVARDLFAADLLAVHTGELILPFEEEEKDLLNLNEAFGIRGAEGDAVIEAAVAHLRTEALQDATDDLAYMTLNVFDGEFPRTFLQTRNLHFTQYRMDQATNNADHWTLRPAGPSARVPRARSERDWFDLWPR